MNLLLIIPAYKRNLSLKRLLDSIKNASFDEGNINIIISFDGGYSKKALSVAFEFQKKFHYGNVEILTQKKNIGLREHIIWCGDQTEEHDAVLILEDDLFVDKFFYYYALEASFFYKEDENIAGIALYSPRYNEYANLPFEPMQNGYTGYFMQIACSWGQIWTKKQWKKFKNWYLLTTDDYVNSIIKLPNAVKNWPDSSWKKYFSAYLVENNLFFFYPYISYTTNCSDPGGVHVKQGSNVYQVPLPSNYRPKSTFTFPNFSYKLSIYDSFYEPISEEIYDLIGYTRDELEIDLYGYKSIELLKLKKYSLTSKNVISLLKKYSLSFKPFEKIPIGDELDSKSNSIKIVETKNIKPENISDNSYLYCYFYPKELFNKVKYQVLKKEKTKIKRLIAKVFKK